MNKFYGEKIAAGEVKAGMRLWVKTHTLGAAVVDILEDRGPDGWLIEVVDLKLQSSVRRERKWEKGRLVSLQVSSVDKFYELPEEPE